MDGLQLVQAMGIPQYAPHIIYLILTEINEFTSIRLSDKTTMLLDLLSAMNNCDEFRVFLQSLSDVNAIVPLDSPFWPGCSVLHLCLMMTTETKLWEELIENLDSQQQLHSLLKAQNPTEDENYEKRINICLETGCNVNVKNAEGLFPIHLAFKLHKAEIVQSLLNRRDNSVVNTDQLSFLHIACAIGDRYIVEDLLNSGAEVNSQTSISFEWSDKSSNFIYVPKNSTALHIATSFQKEEIIEMLLDSGADVYAKNALGFTPIHLSMNPFPKRFHEKSIAQLFLNRTSNLEESLTDSGLSHLHVAAYADDPKAIKKLLRKKATIDSVFKLTSPESSYFAQFANRTPLHVAILKWSHKALVPLVKSGADMSKRTPELETALQSVLKHLIGLPLKKFMKNKYKRRRVDEAIDENGTTLLHVACHLYDFKWAKKLLEKGADVNARVLDDRLHISEDDDCWRGFTPLHFLINAISHKTNGSERARDEFLKLLMDYGADLLAINHDSQSPMLLAHNLACEELFGDECDYEIHESYGYVLLPIADLLLENQSSYKVNPADRNGFTHFHYACMRNKVDIVKKFLDSGIDVNHTANVKFERNWSIDASGFTPLHFAVYYHNVEVSRLLIERGADVNAVSGDQETPFHVAIMEELFDFDLYEMLLNYGANINAPSTFRSIPMHAFFEHVDEITHEHVKFFMSRGSSVESIDKFNRGMFGLAMKKAKPSDREAIFEELSVFCDVKNLVEYGYNIIEDIVAIDPDEKLTVSFYLDAIQRLMDRGCNIDQQNEEGGTALHRAASYDNVEAVEALLLLGANINIIDDKNNAAIRTHPNSSIDLTKKTLAAHVWKMKFVGLEVHELCETARLSIHKVFPLDEDFELRCEKELDELSKEKIGQSLDMRSFLREWGPAMDYPTMSFVQRENVDKFFAKSMDLRLKYPLFCGLLMMQYRKVIARVKMYEIAMNMLPAVLQVHLPALCLDNILKYLDNDEMEYLTDYYEDSISSVV